jgi:phytoene synthase
MGAVWTEREWQCLNARTRSAAVDARTEQSGWHAVARSARFVLRNYSTSFFIVTRFLPPEKRAQVEVVYAAVRYPDEIVDSFPLNASEKCQRLDAWAAGYVLSLDSGSFAKSIESGCAPFAAAFAEVVRLRRIPPEYYFSFLDAMRLDVNPRSYTSVDDLIEAYVYGSAIVVGYFLAHIYGPSRPDSFGRALASARHLGIALQLTNFLRDIGEDQRRGRVYMPADLLRAEGVSAVDVEDASQKAALSKVASRMSSIAETYYALAERDLDAFAPDSRVAIQACIDVYRRLNLRIGTSAEGVRHRESVPLTEKFAVLPGSKYWRLPLAYAGVI